jgi:hypothetical protein
MPSAFLIVCGLGWRWFGVCGASSRGLGCASWKWKRRVLERGSERGAGTPSRHFLLDRSKKIMLK